MQIKSCKICKKEKEINQFYKAKGGKFGVAGTCKECRLQKNKIYYKEKGKEVKLEYSIKNKDKIKERNQKYYNKPEIKSKTKEYRKNYKQNNKEKITLLQKSWVETNKEKVKENQDTYRKENKEKLVKDYKKFYQNNKDKIKFKVKNYIQNNKEAYLANRRKYDKNRRKNIDVKLGNNISRRIHEALRENKQGKHWEAIVGYTTIELKTHLESKFQTGMTWENYGLHGWHIDHIIPRSKLKFKTYECENFKKCWALENLQPLWAKDNLKKGNKF